MAPWCSCSNSPCRQVRYCSKNLLLLIIPIRQSGNTLLDFKRLEKKTRRRYLLITHFGCLLRMLGFWFMWGLRKKNFFSGFVSSLATPKTGATIRSKRTWTFSFQFLLSEPESLKRWTINIPGTCLFWINRKKTGSEHQKPSHWWDKNNSATYWRTLTNKMV